jgi:hypothetical protein
MSFSGRWGGLAGKIESFDAPLGPWALGSGRREHAVESALLEFGQAFHREELSVKYVEPTFVSFFLFVALTALLATGFDYIFYLIFGSAPYSFGRSVLHALLTIGLGWILAGALVGFPYRQRKQDVSN